MEVLFVLTNLVVVSLISFGVLNAAAYFIIWLGRLDEGQDVDVWPVEYFHRHPTYTDEELLQQGFSADDLNGRHAFYRAQIRRKGVELYSRGWVGVLWRHWLGSDAVDGEEGDDVL